jgi:hypothetical protein
MASTTCTRAVYNLVSSIIAPTTLSSAKLSTHLPYGQEKLVKNEKRPFRLLQLIWETEVEAIDLFL